jgi:hypothetical protein
MAQDDGRQHDGVAPLMEPAVLLVTNCEGCRGTGYLVSRVGGHDAPWDGRDSLTTDVPNNTVPHTEEHDPDGHCDGSGRVVREVLLSEFVQMAGAVTFRYSAPSPSEVRSGR